MDKNAAEHERSYSLVGRLQASVHKEKPWLLLSVPNSVTRSVFDAMHEPGIELPPSKDGKLNAHISVMRPEEIDKIGGVDKVTERGHQFHYSLGSLRRVTPAGWPEMSDCWFLSVHSPELERLRRSYGLSPLPSRNGDQIPFHITVAVRRKKVLGNNDLSKAALSGPATAKLALYLSGELQEPFRELRPIVDRQNGYVTLLADPLAKKACLVGGGSEELQKAVQKYFELVEPSPGAWVKLAYSHGLRRIAETMNLVPGRLPGGIPNYASPLTGMLTGGLLTAGLGYGTGKLLTRLMPDQWDQTAMPRTLALLGGAVGASPGALQALSAHMRGKSILSQTDDGRMAEPNRRFSVKLASDSSGLDDLGAAPFRVDGFNRTVLDDPRVEGVVAPQTQLAATSLVTAASYLPGPAPAGWVSPGQIARMAVGMGTGYASAALVGKGLGVLMGMPSSSQETLKNTGMWAGALQALVPHAFP